MPEEGTGDLRSPEALRTWMNSLLTQINHCAKEAEALAGAVSQTIQPPENVLWNEKTRRNILAYEQLQLAAHSLYATCRYITATRNILDRDI